MKRRKWDQRQYESLNASTTSHPEHSLNFVMKLQKNNDLLNRIPYQYQEYSRDYLSGSGAMVEQFRTILGVYLNFMQREIA